ncbi:reticulon-like protein B12 isoform X1 [Tripterygium wilfordii]|uniref:Reticulon-like protein n=1 Tax=Tripterygium wilfordii TaxID=458696 RepID=A0A7J7CSX3_TRIWF|nr:reticulon-like protein B12 isoform X1 [Tripterygium wilfordii]
MGSTDRLFNRQRTVHEILGGGLVADVILWRQKNVTMGILLGTLAAWLVFERSGYTLLSLVSSVLLLLASILFFWSKSAEILNRPAPPLPELHLSEEMVNEAAAFFRVHLNALLSVSQDIALGRNSNLYFKVATYLLVISVIGSLTDFLTLGYISKYHCLVINCVDECIYISKEHLFPLLNYYFCSFVAGLVIILTVPLLYERYEDRIDEFVVMGYRKLQHLYLKFDAVCISNAQKWRLEKEKLS